MTIKSRSRAKAACMVSAELITWGRKKMFFSAAKAVRELGLPQSPVEDALARAVLDGYRAAGS